MAQNETKCTTQIMKWTFAKNEGGRDSGFHDAGVETFKGNFDRYLARELIQNSVDARLDPYKPVHVKFEILKLSREDIPDVSSLATTMARCREYWPTDKKAREFFATAESLTKNAETIALRIGDYNTSGVLGSDTDRSKNWYHLIRCAGSTSKGGGEGGSFGIGKNAPFAASKLRTVLYSTYNTDGEHTFQGVSMLVTHSLPGGSKAQPTGYLGDSQGASIRTKKQIPQTFQRKEHGTDVIILGFPAGHTWKEDLIYSVLDNFWPAIDFGHLVVTVGDQEIHKMNLPGLLESYSGKQDFTAHHYFNAFKNPSHTTHEELRNLKKVSLYLSAGNDGDLPKRIAMIRKTGMVIFSKAFRSAIPFCGAFICANDHGNRTLWEMEPPRHDTWDPDHPEKGVNRRIESEYKAFIISCIRKLLPSDDAKVIAIPGLNRFLPDDDDTPESAFGSSGGKSPSESAERSQLPAKIPGKKIEPSRQPAPPGVGGAVDDAEDDQDPSDQPAGERGRKKKAKTHRKNTEPGAEAAQPLIPIHYRTFLTNAPAGVYFVSLASSLDRPANANIAIWAVGDDQRVPAPIKSARRSGGKDLKVVAPGMLGPVSLGPSQPFDFELILDEPLRLAMEVSAHEA
jgi:hypothetical protein